MFQALLDAGWDINWSLSHAGDALTRAIIGDNVPLVGWLLDHGADPSFNESASTHSTLARAAIHASTTTVGILLAHGVPIKRSRALECAAYYGRVEMVVYLLDHGAEIDEIRDTN